ncbi:MAG: hypothetical protein IAF02_14290 [Anaerolineae bacterium]|nr:hypothetical protein [Anaerolineae bacterium]
MPNDLDIFFLCLAVYNITGMFVAALWLAIAKMDISSTPYDFFFLKLVLFWPYYLTCLLIELVKAHRDFQSKESGCAA